MSNEPVDRNDERQGALIDYVLGQVNDQERRRVERELASSAESQRVHAELRRLIEGLTADRAGSAPPPPSARLRAAIESRFAEPTAERQTGSPPIGSRPIGSRPVRMWLLWAAAACLLLAGLPFGLRQHLRQFRATSANSVIALRAEEGQGDLQARQSVLLDGQQVHSDREFKSGSKRVAGDEDAGVHAGQEDAPVSGFADRDIDVSGFGVLGEEGAVPARRSVEAAEPSPPRREGIAPPSRVASQPDRFGVSGGRWGRTVAENQAETQLELTPPAESLAADGLTRPLAGPVPLPTKNFAAAAPDSNAAGTRLATHPEVSSSGGVPSQGVASQGVPREGVTEMLRQRHEMELEVGRFAYRDKLKKRPAARRVLDSGSKGYGEQYEPIVENAFFSTGDNPLSTFGVDVDTASYANVRRFLNQGSLPPADAVRIEELINYFEYADLPPKDKDAFAVSLEVVSCPWQPHHQLVRIGLKGKEVHRQERPAGNLVFLLDVSGSMSDANKLPLLKQAMKLLADQLTENDRVAIVTYAGDAGLQLDSTTGDQKDKIRQAIDSLHANGSTNGSAGIELAYRKASQHFIRGGTNRVILATDGDLNVGVTANDDLVRLIREKAKSGVFLTVLGFGQGNLKDAKLEQLADNGNGMYAYLDSLREARKVLVEQMAGNLITIAKDVKIQVEFNPAEVQGYRLIGYENRGMATEAFDDDRKDSGDIGAGHTVTVLYEVVPARRPRSASSGSHALKYQNAPEPQVPPVELTPAARSGELLTLLLRYKEPDSDESTLREHVLKQQTRAFNRASADLRFAAAVAAFGMLLRDSAYRGDATFAAVEEIASSSLGRDQGGYRTEFLDLVRRAASLK